MPAKFVTHGVKRFVGEIRLAARAETFIERRRQLGDGFVDRGSRNRHPDCPRLRQLPDHFSQSGTADGVFANQLRDRLRRPVKHHAPVPALHRPAHHVCSHPAEADHSQLHRLILSRCCDHRSGHVEDADAFAISPGDWCSRMFAHYLPRPPIQGWLLKHSTPNRKSDKALPFFLISLCLLRSIPPCAAVWIKGSSRRQGGRRREDTNRL
jgi:hypothetical protein